MNYLYSLKRTKTHISLRVSFAFTVTTCALLFDPAEGGVDTLAASSLWCVVDCSYVIESTLCDTRILTADYHEWQIGIVSFSQTSKMGGDEPDSLRTRVQFYVLLLFASIVIDL